LTVGATLIAKITKEITYFFATKVAPTKRASPLLQLHQEKYPSVGATLVAKKNR